MEKFRDIGTVILALPACAWLATLAPAVAPAAAAQATAEAPRELTADQQIKHVLNRLAFGARPGDVERVRALGVDWWIARQLEPSRIEDVADRGRPNGGVRVALSFTDNESGRAVAGLYKAGDTAPAR